MEVVPTTLRESPLPAKAKPKTAKKKPTSSRSSAADAVVEAVLSAPVPVEVRDLLRIPAVRRGFRAGTSTSRRAAATALVVGETTAEKPRLLYRPRSLGPILWRF